MTLRILLENLLRHEAGARVTAEQVQALLGWCQPASGGALEVSPSRVFLHDTNGVPALADPPRRATPPRPGALTAAW